MAPTVSILMPTFNRRDTLAEALASAAAQTFEDFEALVVNDGGEPVGDLVEALGDARFRLIERRENRGKAASLNEALAEARGRIVAYLDDDDLWYPHHLQSLHDALEACPDCGAAYTDLYKVRYRPGPDGSRLPLAKRVAVSRDFDRFYLCCFNLALHVSLAHRRNLMEHAGLYNEALGVLVDWDMTRRLAFFTDLLHVPEITGEYYVPAEDSDRISDRLRRDRQKYAQTILAILTTRPPKPWPAMPDLLIVPLPERIDARVGEMLRGIYGWTFMPYRVRLPAGRSAVGRLNVSLPHFEAVPTADDAPLEARIEAALAGSDADYVALVPPAAEPGILWVEDALHAALADPRAAITIEGHADAHPGLVLARERLIRVLEGRGTRSLVQALRQKGVAIRPPRPDERALALDRGLGEAEKLEAEGSWVRAARAYRDLATHHGNDLWMNARAAAALARDGSRDDEALALVAPLNAARPTPETLFVEARLHHRAERTDRAVALLEQARALMKGKDDPCN